MIRNKKGFTLVELLAVIVILAIILVIAVPQIMKTIDSARNGALSASAKLIAVAAEKEYLARKTIGDTEFNPDEVDIECADVVKENTNDYQSCDISFDENGKATVTLIGKGKFAGKYICNGNKTTAEVSENACSGGAGGGNQELTPVNFANDSWSTIIAAVQAAETNETDYPYNVGDTKTIQMELDSNVDGPENYTLRVANTTKCNGTLASETACGFVIEFVDIIKNHQMNTVGNYVGGWPASALRTYINDTIYNAIPKDLRDGIIDTCVVSGHGLNDAGTRDDDNHESTDKLYLLSSREVWGNNENGDSAAGETITRQLDWYINNSKVKLNGTTPSTWWLRSPHSSLSPAFSCVGSSGSVVFNVTNNSLGVSPAFRIGLEEQSS